MDYEKLRKIMEEGFHFHQLMLGDLSVHLLRVEGKLDELDSKVTVLDSKVGGLDSKVDGLAVRIDQMDTKFERRFDRLERRFDGVTEELREMRLSNNRVLEAVINLARLPGDVRQDIRELKERVSELEDQAS